MQVCMYGAHLSARGLHGDRTAPVLFSLHVSAESDGEQCASVRGRNEIRPPRVTAYPRSVPAGPRQRGRAHGVKPCPAFVNEKP